MREATVTLVVLGMVAGAATAKPGSHGEHHSNEHSEHFYRTFHETARNVHDALHNIQAIPMLIRTMKANTERNRRTTNKPVHDAKNEDYKITRQELIEYIRSQIVPRLNDYNSDLVMLEQRKKEPPQESTDYVLKAIPIAYHLGKELEWTFPAELQLLIDFNYETKIDDAARSAAAARVKETLDRILQ